MLRLARRELLRWSARYLGGLPPPQGSPCSQKRWRKYRKLSKQKSTRPLQEDSEVCITDAQSLDRLSLQSQEELEEVNLERYLQVVSPVILTSMIITITTRVRAVQQVGRRTLTLCSQIPPVFRGSQTSYSRSSGSYLCFGFAIIVVVLRSSIMYIFFFYHNITLQPRKHCVLDGLWALSEFGGKSGCWEAQLSQVALFVFFLFSKYHLQDCVDRHHVFDHHSGQ